jgi:hypothetical protein
VRSRMCGLLAKPSTHHARGPNVAELVVRGPLAPRHFFQVEQRADFGRDVVGRAAHRVEPLGGVLREPEVGQLDVHVRLRAGEQQVLGLSMRAKASNTRAKKKKKRAAARHRSTLRNSFRGAENFEAGRTRRRFTRWLTRPNRERIKKEVLRARVVHPGGGKSPKPTVYF